MPPKPSAPPTRVVAYTRVSTIDQASEGVSLALQKQKLDAYAFASGLQVVEWLEDAGLSAKTLERPGLQRALALLEHGQAEGLLVLKLDRLTRSVRDLGDLVERYFASRFSLLSVGDSIDTRSAGGRLVLNVLASVAQWEREIIGERTREAMQELKRQGRRLGAPPLEAISEGGQQAQHRAVQLRAEGKSLRKIAATLVEEERPTQKGGRWQAETVRLLLMRVEPRAYAAGSHPQPQGHPRARKNLVVA